MTVPLRDVCGKIGSGATPKGGKESYQTEGVSLIRSQNILDWTFSYNGLAYINDEQAAKLSNVIVEKDDILLNITGDSVARAVIVPDQALPARVNQHVAIIRTDEAKIDPVYLLAFLISSKVHLLQIASSGATRNALTKAAIESLELELPPLNTQVRISNIIRSIQAKLSLNNRINDYLAA